MIIYIQDYKNKWEYIGSNPETWQEAYNILQFKASLKDYWDVNPKYKKAIVINFDTLELRIYSLNKGELTRVK